MSAISTAVGFVTGGSATRLTATLLVGFSLGSFGAWKVQDWRYGAQAAQREQAAREAHQENEHQADKAATHFEQDRANNEARTRTITVEVEKIVDRPVYLQQCFDADGLRILNDQIRRTPDSGQPGQPVPGSAAAG